MIWLQDTTLGLLGMHIRKPRSKFSIHVFEDF